MFVLVGKPAHSCKDFINQHQDNITLNQDYYRKRLRVLNEDNKIDLHSKDYIMIQISFFKLQAKNLKKDFKTGRKIFVEDLGFESFVFEPKYFDVDEIVLSYDLSDEEISNFSLMKAQHFIAQLVGFRKWSDLLNASSASLELAKLLFENQHKLSLEDWEMYVIETEMMNNFKMSDEVKLEVFKNVFLKDGDFAALPQDIRIV